MKRPPRLLTAFVLLLMLAGPGAPFAAEPTAWVRVIVHQPGVVLLDGEQRLDLTRRSGRMPIPWTQYSISHIAVTPGTHTFEWKRADPMAVPPWESVVIDAADGDTATVRLGRPRILTAPTGARVLVNGEEVGNSPTWLDPTTLPGKKVLIEHPGYQRITIEGDSLLQETRLSGSLRVELTTLSPQKLATPPTPTAEKWIDRHRTLALIGTTTLLAGGVAAGLAFKHHGDDYFEDYQHTGSPDKQDELFSQAQKYDRLSLIGWAVGEAAFFATFFLLIREAPRPLVPNPAAGPGFAASSNGVELRYTKKF